MDSISFSEFKARNSFQGSFLENIRSFTDQELKKTWEHLNILGDSRRKKMWKVSLEETNGFRILLYIFKEDVTKLSDPFCEHCRYIGWKNHFVSRLRYHVIVPAGDCLASLYSPTHLLHGMIHGTGYGHMLQINGHRGGSISASGSDLMDLFDRICTRLQIREIVLKDFSKKGSMELRLLTCIATGMPWFGIWLYDFCRGQYGVTNQMYKEAIETLRSLQLDHILEDFENLLDNTRIRDIISSYFALQPKTLADLFCSMIHLGKRLRASQPYHLIQGPRMTEWMPPPDGIETRAHNVFLALKYLYKKLLEEDYPVGGILSSEMINREKRIILNVQYLKKVFAVGVHDNENLQIFLTGVCGAEEGPSDWETLPEVLLFVGDNIKFGDLKSEGQRVLMETFCIENFQVNWVDGVELQDNDVITGLTESGSNLRLRGEGSVMTAEMNKLESSTKERVEVSLKTASGLETPWTVRCICGDPQPDGEQMITCNKCNVRVHKFCAGIEVCEAPPVEFSCTDCERE